MRYRIQIQPLLGAYLCVISSYEDLSSSTRVTSKMYTIQDSDYGHMELVELLGELQREVGESSS